MLDSESEGEGGACDGDGCCGLFRGGGGGFAEIFPMGRRGIAIFGGADGGELAESRCNGGSDGGNAFALLMLVERGGGGGSSFAGGRRGEALS
jgi:hypothetical protein